MLLGAFAAFYVVRITGNLWLGVLTAIVVGGLMGLAMAFVTVNLHAQQGISGIGFYLFGLGMSDLLFQKLLGTVETVQGFPQIYIPVLSDIPGIGDIFFRQNVMVYLAYLLVPIAWFVLNKTTLGLKIRSVGENPDAADSLGVNVGRVRYFTVILGGCLVWRRWCFLIHCLAQCLSTEHDQWAGIYRGGVGLFWRMASHRCVGRRSLV